MRIEFKGLDADGASVALRGGDVSLRTFGASGLAGKLAGPSAQWIAQSGLAYWWKDGLPVPVGLGSQSRVHLFLKRTTDIVLSALAIVALAPLLLLVAVLVKLESPGPVLFRQYREGLGGELFEMYKFRSMRMDECDVTGLAQVKLGDPRLTKLGRFIRQRSLDELPQLFNVLLGHMSLVGPRPHVPNMLAAGQPYEKLVPYYALRYAMRPGLTGWAQANGLRGATDDATTATARIDHDIAYVQNFSWWLDLNCIVRTVKNELLSSSGV